LIASLLTFARTYTYTARLLTFLYRQIVLCQQGKLCISNPIATRRLYF